MGRVVHFEIHCSDLDRAERFYRDVFGWEIGRWEGAPIDYRLVTTGSASEPGIDGALVERRGSVDGPAVIAFVNTIEVDDLTETERRILSGGGEVAMPRDEILGVGHVAYYKDTEGNIFGALQPAAR